MKLLGTNLRELMRVNYSHAQHNLEAYNAPLVRLNDTPVLPSSLGKLMAQTASNRLVAAITQPDSRQGEFKDLHHVTGRNCLD